MSGLEIRNIQKSFGSQTALSEINLVVRQGEFFSLLGPSGCGKSTLLRILAGLESATSGEILWDGKRIDQLPARERPFNMVFQKYALFPHLDVFENVAFGLRIKNTPKNEISSRVKEVLSLVNLTAFESRLPETLSGGQAQRVALARALVNRPQCVLLDEPLTALDAKLREHMQTELRLLQRRLGLTFIFVTHDQEEAMLMSDRVAVMNDGRVEQMSEPRHLYEHPSSLFCARFIGRRNELSADSMNMKEDGFAEFTMADARLSGRRAFEGGNSVDRAVKAFVRPELLRVVPTSTTPVAGQNALEGEIVQILFRGVRTEIVVDLGNRRFVRALVEPGESKLKTGEKVRVEFDPDETHVFLEAETE